MATTTLVTSEQYLAMPDEFHQSGNRIKDELIGGEIVRMPPSSFPHDLIKSRINRFLARYLEENRHLGIEPFPEAGAQIHEYDTFVPDLSLIRRDRISLEERRIFRGSPDIAIEIVSPSETAKHLQQKVDSYFRGGSQSVWVVYPEAKSVEVHTTVGTRKYKANEEIEDPVLPGFSVPVASFFELT